ncbi:Ppx/GppA phosphatase family protein [Breznakiellaceae bacterium SP9]
MAADSRLIAIIEIGSTGIRLLVAQITPDGTWHEMDKAGKPAALGRDVFNTGQISRDSYREVLSVLKNYRELLAGWGIESKDTHVIATSALRIARNRDLIADHIWRQVGFRLNIVEGIEENRLMYLAVRFSIKAELAEFWKANSMIIEVGGGSTELMLMASGKMVSAHSLHLGTILIDQQSRAAMGSTQSRERFLYENIRKTSGVLSSEMELGKVQTFIAAGSDAIIAAVQIGTPFNAFCRIMERRAFINFVEQVRGYSVEECVQKLHISFADAEGIITGLMIYRYFLDHTAAEHIIVPQISIREGLLIDLEQRLGTQLQEEFFSQIIASTVNLGRKYKMDEAHSRFVADNCLILFDALLTEHGMNRHERLLLEAAGILHDIGIFIRVSEHHKHSQYIVNNSEIFGLHKGELSLIANVVRYHRSDPPSSNDIEYLSLHREERILVLKMAAILRVADALDRGHTQQIGTIHVEIKGDLLLIHIDDSRDLSHEHIGLGEKGGMFQDVYGYKVVLD